MNHYGTVNHSHLIVRPELTEFTLRCCNGVPCVSPPSVLQSSGCRRSRAKHDRMSSGRDDDRGRAYQYHDDRSRYSQQHGQQPPRRKRSRSPSRDDSVWGRDRRQWARPSRTEDDDSV